MSLVVLFQASIFVLQATDVSQSDSAASLVSDGDVELPVKTTIASDVSIVSLQSTACPGAILQLDRILDAEHVLPFRHYLMFLIYKLMNRLCV